MLKRLRSKKLFSVVIICLSLISIAVVAANSGILDKAKDAIQVDNKNGASNVVRSTTDDDSDNMYNILQSKYTEKEELYRIVENYALLKVVYQPPKEDIDYLCDLVLNGCDLDKIIEIYKFWDDTEEDIGIIKTIYDTYTPEIKKNKYWVEDGFNRVTNNKNGVLNVEQVKEYVNKGLSNDDIAVANKLCRKGKYTIQQILDTKVSGMSWVEVIYDTYSTVKNNDGFKLEKQKLNDYKKIIDGNKILRGIFLSKRTGKDINKYMDMSLLNDRSLSTEYDNYLKPRISLVMKKLQDKGLWDDAKESKEQNKKYVDYMKSKVKENGIAESKYDELKRQGKNDLDILNASIVSKKHNRDIDNVFDAISKGSKWDDLHTKGVQ